MAASPWVWPMLAMVGVVFAVWMRLYQTRIGEMKRRRIHPQSVASAKQMAEALEDTRAADHFRNLFEMPVLFYVACLVALATGVESPVALGLAWLFVAGRAAQAWIACTYNKVMHRFQAYLVAGFAVFALWLVLGLGWAGLF